MAAESSSRCATGIILRSLIFLCLSKIATSYSYPMLGGRRYVRPAPARRSPYFPMPVARHRTEYQLPDYDDEVLVGPQDDYEYTGYEKYPYAQNFAYYPGKEYYRDQTGRSPDGYEYVDDRFPLGLDEETPQEAVSSPYGQETWFEEELPSYDSNAQANAAFMRNLIMAQMYQDAKNRRATGYDSTADDYDDQHWLYSVPATDVDENEKIKQYLKEDEEVRELELLARKKNKNGGLKEKDSFRKPNSLGGIEQLTNPKGKMSDEQYFDMQKQIILNGRKKGLRPYSEGLRLAKKQDYEPIDVKTNFWDFQNNRERPRYLESATNSIKKLNANQNVKTAKDSEVSGAKTETSSTAAATPTPPPKKHPVAGQKEVVLLRPSNPVRRPFPELSSRSPNKPSAFDTITRMLEMDGDTQQRGISRPQKRFILSDDQLLSELKGLKKV